MCKVRRLTFGSGDPKAIDCLDLQTDEGRNKQYCLSKGEPKWKL